MPSINLRLTDAQLEELRAWAFDGRRSVQKEIVWRLFESGQAGLVVDGPPRSEVDALRDSGAAGARTPSADSRAQGQAARVTAPDEHFKPHPKPGAKK